MKPLAFLLTFILLLTATLAQPAASTLPLTAATEKNASKNMSDPSQNMGDESDTDNKDTDKDTIVDDNMNTDTDRDHVVDDSEDPDSPDTDETESYTINEKIKIIPKGTGSRAKKTVTVYKKHSIRNSAGKQIAEYVLKATFTYNGKTATCTKAAYQTHVNNTMWEFTDANARKSKNKATGSYTAKFKVIGQKVSKTLTISCDKNGTIRW